MSQFINIHTHRPSLDTDGSLQILSVMVTGRAETPRSGLFSAAIHPYSAHSAESAWLDRLAQVVRQERCVAIGETGLDLRDEYARSIKQQNAIFEEHVFLSNKLCKPLIIHSVRALKPTLKILEKAHQPFIIHGFAGGQEGAKDILEAGGYISLGEKIIRDEALAQRVADLPHDRLLLETDDNLTPIEDIYEALSKIKRIDIQRIKQIIETNFRTIFPNII